MQKGIETTGQLRSLLAKAASDVLSGELDIEKASALHKLTKNITESLYCEVKTAVFQNDMGVTIGKLGSLGIGDPSE